MIEITANDYPSFQKICADFNISEEKAIFIDPKEKKREIRRARAFREAPERTINKSCSDWIFYSQARVGH